METDKRSKNSSNRIAVIRKKKQNNQEIQYHKIDIPEGKNTSHRKEIIKKYQR